nr:Hsp20 family protein [uncultured Caldimonas sp.]
MSNLRIADFLNLDPTEDVFRGFLRPLRWEVPMEAPQIKLDVTEDNSAYTIKAEIPGVRKEDIDVRVDGNVVSLSAEVKKTKEEKEEGRVLRSERYYGMVRRSFSLGSDVDQGKSVAKYQDGVLTLTLPKRSSGESRRLQIG